MPSNKYYIKRQLKKLVEDKDLTPGRRLVALLHLAYMEKMIPNSPSSNPPKNTTRNEEGPRTGRPGNPNADAERDEAIQDLLKLVR